MVLSTEGCCHVFSRDFSSLSFLEIPSPTEKKIEGIKQPGKQQETNPAQARACVPWANNGVDKTPLGRHYGIGEFVHVVFRFGSDVVLAAENDLHGSLVTTKKHM